MARSTEQIEDALRANVEEIDNRVDLKVGPIWDYLLAPVPPQLASIESSIEQLKRYYSPNFSDVATPLEARDFAVNFGTGPSTGAFAKAIVVYYRNSAPPAGQTYTVPVGSLVMTVDGNLVFKTTQTITMSGDYAPTYFNPTTQRYEISTTVTAVSPGRVYNIPANHLRRMQPQILGFDGIQQITAATDGTEPEDIESVALRVQRKFKGLERNSLGGIVTLIQEFSPTQVGSVRVIRPTDRIEFRRLTNGPSLDVCVQGQSSLPFTEDFLATGGETSIPITENRTVTSIESVAVNGNVLPSSQWAFRPDTSLEYRHSTRASSSIQLTTGLTANALVEITGIRNDLLDGIQNLFYADKGLFFTDILIRSFESLPIVVSIEVRINDGDPDDIQSLIASQLTYDIEPDGEIPEILIPNTLASNIRAQVPEVESIKVLKFSRKSGAINDVEIIVPKKNEIPKFDAVASSIIVRV
jgi:hypothetical protein